MQRPDFFSVQNGNKAPLPFPVSEYEARLSVLRDVMAKQNLDAVWFTSMQNVAYYSGFLYCAFGRNYGCIVTQSECVSLSANIDFGQPWRRSVADNVVFTDWRRDNYLRAAASVLGTPQRIGIEADHLNLQLHQKIAGAFPGCELVDVSDAVMRQRMVKSDAEIALIKEGARIADLGGEAVKAAIQEGRPRNRCGNGGKGRDGAGDRPLLSR